MKRRTKTQPASNCSSATSEMLLLPDGRVLVHNLTPELANWLHEMNPDDVELKPRAIAIQTSRNKQQAP